MKNLKFLFIVLLALCISCERDDICAEGTATTPRLFIEFYDAGNTDTLLSVPRLTVYGEGLATDPTAATSATLIFNSNTNSVELPLQIGNENETTTSRFILERDSNLRIDGTGTSNIDIIEISYTPDFQYVSRACGYKSIFNNLSITEDPTDSEPWISSINVIETTIDNENTVHVQIFH